MEDKNITAKLKTNKKQIPKVDKVDKAEKVEKAEKAEKAEKEDKVVISDAKNINLYKNFILEEYIYLKPIDLNNKIDAIILQKLQKKVEGRCIKIGYVMPTSVKILVRSLGIINNASFDGSTTYKITYTADICNPVIGQIIQCQVGNIDKSQTICYIMQNNTNDLAETSPIEIYLFKQNHLGNTDFMKLKVGDIINVKIILSKWEFKDQQIISIAQYVNTI